MLSSSDLGVVDRDPTIPALRLLLDREALSVWLSDRTGTDCAVRPRRLRYKKGTSCVLAFDLVIESRDGRGRMPCLAKTYAGKAAMKAEKSVNGLSTSQQVAHDLSLPLVVTTAVGDRHLPALGKVLGGEDGFDLLRRVVPEGVDVRGSDVRTVRHNPERRWVGRLETTEGSRFALRAYRTSRVESHRRAYATFKRSRVRTPALVGISRRHGLLAVEWMDGTTLSACKDPAAFTAAGKALAQLHAYKPYHLPDVAPDDVGARVHEAAAHVGVLLPELHAQALDLARRTGDALAPPRDRLTRLHGDFSADQVVVDAQGEVAVIDLDSASVGDPAADLGSARAKWLSQGEWTPDEDMPEDLLAALYAGYGEVLCLPPQPLMARHEAAHLLRRAVEPFRRGEPEWAEQMSRILDLAQKTVDGASSLAGGTR